MDQRDERICVETQRYRITGNLKLPRDGYRSRMTDFLNANERTFIALTDVEIAPIDGSEEPRREEFVTISRAQITLAYAAPAEA